MIKGIVPDFGYDVKLAIQIDGEKAEDIPERGNGQFKTNVSCNNNATGEWDYNAWNLKLDNVSEGTKCNLEFTTNGISEEEYQKQLRIGIEYRRSNYREKNITELYNSGALYTQIGNCTFDDVYVGDYFITTKNDHNVTWLIADLNNYLHTGDQDIASNAYPKQEGGGLEICHATIIPAVPLENAQMNVTSDATEAYHGSQMKQETLPSILKDYIANW